MNKPLKEIERDDLIAHIRLYQDRGQFHPLTCGNDSRHALLEPAKWKGGVVLLCPDCDYMQEHIPPMPDKSLLRFGPMDDPSGDIAEELLCEEDPGSCCTCGAPWELVRPGKSQPTCHCDDICPRCNGDISYHADPDPRWPNLSGYICQDCGFPHPSDRDAIAKAVTQVAVRRALKASENKTDEK